VISPLSRAEIESSVAVVLDGAGLALDTQVPPSLCLKGISLLLVLFESIEKEQGVHAMPAERLRYDEGQQPDCWWPYFTEVRSRLG
jgi:hypothetical protein